MPINEGLQGKLWTKRSEVVYRLLDEGDSPKRSAAE